MFNVYIDDNLAKSFKSENEAVDFKFVEYAVFGNFPKDCITIKEE